MAQTVTLSIATSLDGLLQLSYRLTIPPGQATA
jgi:hypothetical protein